MPILSTSVQQESLEIGLGDKNKLHLQRFFLKKKLGTPVLMLHGSIENGRIFYSENRKGLAPYLAAQGYEVYVADLRGRGKSHPKISRHSHFGQTEAICEDLPAFIDEIIRRRGKVKQHWIAHSWGGVLLMSMLARFPKYAPLVKKIVCFGTKRNVHVQNLDKFLIIDLFWNYTASLLTKVLGYLPAKELKIGSDNETKKFHHQVRLWVKSGYPWVDSQDGFDYARAIRKIKLPPAYHLTGIADTCLGHPNDVFAFIQECGSKNYRFKILSKENGNLHDYDHVNILTHPDAVKDHFVDVSRALA
ncbi:MAG: alpha/beta fold hydrolase [Deltaproteobacteria bacterium]|nr:alpha/beta fold hydrolase [Deltaproteobacteria bacterium]